MNLIDLDRLTFSLSEKVTDWKQTMEVKLTFRRFKTISIIFNDFLQDLIKDLYSYRDRFFETHTIEKASEKRELVEKKMKEVLDEFDNLTRK